MNSHDSTTYCAWWVWAFVKAVEGSVHFTLYRAQWGLKMCTNWLYAVDVLIVQPELVLQTDAMSTQVIFDQCRGFAHEFVLRLRQKQYSLKKEIFNLWRTKCTELTLFFGLCLYLMYNHQISGLISNYGYFLLNDCRKSKLKLKIIY